MPKRRSAQDADLQALYDRVPNPHCTGRCVDSCGPIDMSPRERQRLRERGYRLPSREEQLEEYVRTGDYTCPALVDGRCGVYDIRPMVCRLWGAVSGMPCVYGCEPTEGRLDDTEGLMLLADSMAAGGAPAGEDRLRLQAVAEHLTALPEYQAHLQRELRSDR